MQRDDIQQMERVAGDCQDGDTCPTIYKTNRGTAVIQGYMLSAGSLALLTLPNGETAVEIPVHVLQEAARALSA